MIYEFNGIFPVIAKTAWVHEMAYVSGEVELGENVTVWPCAVIRGDVAKIRVGARSNIQDGAVIHATHANSEFTGNGHATTIGEDVTIGHNAVIHGCTIGNEVLIGMNATVLDGAVVESQVLIAAGSLVPPKKRLESGWLYVGNPAKKLRELSDKERQFFKYSALHYVALGDKHVQTTAKIC